MSGAEIVGVAGGDAGIAAMYAGIRALADDFDAAGDELRAWGTDGLRLLADADLATSAPLSPGTFAAAEAAVVSAASGPAGLLPGALAWEADAELVRAAVAGLATSDRLAHEAIELIDWHLGYTAGTAVRIAGPLPLAVVAGAWVLTPDPERRWLAGEAEQWAVDHPGVVEHAVNAGGGLLSGLLMRRLGDNRAATALLASAYRDGTARTTPDPTRTVPSARRQPASVADLVGHVAEVADLSPDPDSAGNGTIEVQTLDGGTERTRHIVYLPGTDDIATLPAEQDDTVRDTGADLRSAAGLPTACQEGILEALHQAGVQPGEPVLLVGHSLGGMDAAALAARDTGFSITDVVTAGSPTAQVSGYPAGTHLLSLEHRGDVVPLTDGEPNPDTRAQTTVTFDDGPRHGIVEAHGFDHYVAGAAAADASADPSISAQVQRLHEHGFLAGDGAPPVVTSTIYRVVRVP